MDPFRRRLWKKYGLSLSPGHDADAGEMHDLVVDYVERHPLEIPQLFHDNGELEYFEVLYRVEFEQDRRF